MTDKNIRIEEAIAAAMEGEPINADIDVQDSGELHYFDLDEVDFAHKHNIRREDKYESRIARKAQELMVDGFIRTALIVTEIIGSKDKPRGTCGFLRHGALRYIREKHPDVYAEKFHGKVPYRLLRGTEEQRQRLMLDHGSEELLDEYELALTVKKYLIMGLKESQIAVLLSPLFYQMTDQATKRKFNARVQELREKGSTQKALNMNQLNLHFWRRRVQHLKRIVSAPPAALTWHKEYVDGLPGRYAISQKCAEELRECQNDSEVISKIQSHSPSKSGDQVKGWGRARVLEARKITQSEYLGKQMDVILGEEDATVLVDLEEQLLRIEVALKKNPEAFWKMIDKLSA